jgi:hypothetical protein
MKEKRNTSKLNTTTPIRRDLGKIGIGNAIDIKETDRMPNRIDRGLICGKRTTKETYKKRGISRRHSK